MVNREVVILKGICTKAVEWGFLTINPVKGLKLEKEKPRLRFLREPEQHRLVESCGKEPKAPYLRPAVIVDLNNGLRKEELFSLIWPHVDMERNVIKVEDGKGGYTRYVPINKTVRIQFLKLLEKKKGDYVFHDQYGRRIKDIKRSFQSALERAGLSDVRFHDLRRTFGTMCVFKNVPNPSSAVRKVRVNEFNELRFQSGDFLHYIFNYLRSVGQKYFHPLKQNLQLFWRRGDNSQPDGFVFCWKNNIK